MNRQVRVNLLPSEVGQKNAARRLQGLVGVAGLGVLGLLALLYFWQVGQVNDAREVLEAEQAVVADLRDDVQELSEFQRLRNQGDTVNSMISALLSGEVSYAGILQDFAAVMPSDAAVEDISIAADEAGGAEFGASGVSLLGHAPGLERLLISMEKAAAFENVFFGSSSIDENGFATFDFSFQLTPLILTNRYIDGLPEVMR